MTDFPKHPTKALDGLRWEDRSDPDSQDPDHNWHLLDADGALIAEAYQREDGIKWHCKTSDWRAIAPDIETAKLRCVVSHVAFLYMTWADQRVKAELERKAQ